MPATIGAHYNSKLMTLIKSYDMLTFAIYSLEYYKSCFTNHNEIVLGCKTDNVYHKYIHKTHNRLKSVIREGLYSVPHSMPNASSLFYWDTLYDLLYRVFLYKFSIYFLTLNIVL